jgi:predicted RNA binding protein YcfA (HicA-like mRNA interferase family)
MTKLPTDLSGRELIRILIRVGFAVQRQRGSHIILRRESPFAVSAFQITKRFVSELFAPF